MKPNAKFTMAAVQHNDSEDIKNHPAPQSKSEVKEFNERLESRFGHGFNEQPLFRAIWGQSKEALMFACDLWRMKYLGATQTIKYTEGYLVINRDNPEDKQYISAKKARGSVLQDEHGNWLRNERDICIPKLREEYVEIGVPRWVVERLATPQELVGQGIKDIEAEWNANRWLDKNDPDNPTGRTVDVLGQFPRDGQYVAFMYVEDFIYGKTESGGDEQVIIGTKYKSLVESVLDDVAVEWKKFNQWRETSEEQYVANVETRTAENQADLINTGVEELRDVVEHKLLHKTILPVEPVSKRRLELVKETFGVKSESEKKDERITE